jgi:hypothetical protein
MKRALLVLLVLGSIGGIIGYGVFEARRLLEGPSVTILSPANGSAFADPLLSIEGVARNISFLTINDKPALTDENGYFTAKMTPPPGVAAVVVEAEDRFGRRASSEVRITMLNFCPIT